MMKMWEVEVTGKETVKPVTATLPHLRTHSLSWLDMIIPEDHVAFVLFYPNPTSDFLSTLKTSLPQALATFYPLAGRLSHDNTSVDCNDEGVSLFEAHAIADSPLSHLIRCAESNPNVSVSVNKLLPCDDSCSINGNAPLLNIQITTFVSCGGIAVGCCLSHKITDGHSAAMFIKTWTRAARSEKLQHVDRIHMMPAFDAASRLMPPSNDESLSNTDMLMALQSILAKDHDDKEQARLVTKKFVITEHSIRKLKESSTVSHLTRVQAVIALIWRCCMSAREDATRSAVAGTLVNMRGKVKALPENLFGNLFCVTLAPSDSDKDIEGAKARSEEKVNASIKAMSNEKLTSCEEGDGWSLVQEAVFGAIQQLEKMFDNGNAPDTYTFTSWTRFAPLYEADFGWGKPMWVAMGRQPMKNEITLLARNEDVGKGIEAWVTLTEKEMARFDLEEEIN